MADKTIDVYLNDHLAGATFGSDLARQLIAHGEGTPLGPLMRRLAEEIEQDRQTLSDLMERLGTSQNPVKQATTWLAEKASRVKLTGMSSGEGELGTFLALEALSLGVEGKKALWIALKQVQGERPQLAALDLDELIARATSQREALEVERLAAARRALDGGSG
jgi:hypothetical protein